MNTASHYALIITILFAFLSDNYADSASHKTISSFTVFYLSFDDEHDPANFHDAVKKPAAGSAPKQTPLCKGEWVDGISGKAFKPDSSEPYKIEALNLANWGANSAEFYANFFNIDFWIMPDQISNQYLISGYGKDRMTDNAQDRLFFILRLETNGSLVFGVDVHGGNMLTAKTPAGAIEENKWTHIVATFDNSEAKIYINGVETSRSPENAEAKKYGAILKPVSLLIGTSPGQKLNENFHGAFDEIKLEYRAATEEKLKQAESQ